MIPKVLLDFVRYALILGSTGYVVVWIWRWHWLAALVAAIPVYIVLLNVFGFLTLPLYVFTPEVKRAKEMEKALFAKFKQGR